MLNYSWPSSTRSNSERADQGAGVSPYPECRPGSAFIVIDTGRLSSSNIVMFPGVFYSKVHVCNLASRGCHAYPTHSFPGTHVNLHRPHSMHSATRLWVRVCQRATPARLDSWSRRRRPAQSDPRLAGARLFGSAHCSEQRRRVDGTAAAGERSRHDKRDQRSRTVLHVAAETGDKNMISLLLERSANPNSTDSAGRTVLFAAVIRGSESVIKSLLSHVADTNARDCQGLVLSMWLLSLDQRQLHCYFFQTELILMIKPNLYSSLSHNRECTEQLCNLENTTGIPSVPAVPISVLGVK